VQKCLAWRGPKYACDTQNVLLLETSSFFLAFQGLQSLTLESSNEVNTNLVLQLLAVRCRKLLKLVLNQSKFRHDLFHDLCEKSSENLTELKLSKTQIGDLELAIVGSFCPKLKHLDVGDVTKVSDKGLQTIYKQVNLQGKPSSSHGKCSKLVRYVNIFLVEMYSLDACRD